jgi:hypothetical protein
VEGLEFGKEIDGREVGVKSSEEEIVLLGVLKVREPVLKVETDSIQLIEIGRELGWKWRIRIGHRETSSAARRT